jgi:hypothetical protein
MEDHQDKHTIGGITSIVSGVIGILGTILIIFFIVFLGVALNQATMNEIPEFPFDIRSFVIFFYGAFGFISFILGILGIVGGAFALKRKFWGLALTGAIAGVFTFFPCGIVAIIFISMARPEFIKSGSLNAPGM